MEGLRSGVSGTQTTKPRPSLRLLATAGIEVVADVRSQPSSRFNPHFNRASLREALVGRRIRYVFLGHQLGGRPPEQEFYDDEGHVLYDEVARSERFRAGLRRLMEGAETFRVAMLCSEENPTNCHRRLLLTRVLSLDGVSVEHIRGNGTILSEAQLSELVTEVRQDALFEGEDGAWRSTQSVSRSTRRKTSSGA